MRALFTSIFILLSAAQAGAASLVLDPPHTIATFSVVHLAIARVHGTIPMVSGTVTTGPNDVPTAATATFDITKLDSNDSIRDGSLKSPDFFDAAKYPTMTFVSEKITGTPAAFTMIGLLTMHGVTKQITLKCSVTGALTDKGKHRVGYTANVTIDRRDWGMTFTGPLTAGNLIAGNEVTISVEADGAEK